MNPAALRANLGDLPKGATIIVDTHDFTARNLTKAGYAANPLEDDSLAEYALHPVDLTGMTVEAVKEFGLSRKDAARAKNMFALGPAVVDVRPPDRHHDVVPARSGSPRSPTSATPTSRRSTRGWNFGETTEAFVVSYEIKPAPMAAGHLPQHHRQPRAGLRPARRRRAVRACRCSSAPTRSPRPPTSSTS